MRYVTRFLFQYAQIRHMFNAGFYWEPVVDEAFAEDRTALEMLPVNIERRPAASV
jgi:hypothetical protein